MIFAPDQTQLELRDGAREFLRGICTPELLRELRDNTDQKRQLADSELWTSLVELGLTGYLVSESNGGLGMNSIGFSMLAEEIGYVALPEPLSDVAGVTLPILNALGMASECESVINGDTRILSAHALNPYINQLNDTDQLLAISHDEIRLLSAGDFSANKAESIDPLRNLFSIELPANAGQVIAEGEQAAALERLACVNGGAFCAAELLGLSSAMIDMATAYAKDRQQFGKPIGSYQAVKHLLANALVAVEFARPVVLRAAEGIATCHPDAERFVAHAKIAANDAATQAVEVAIQIHGGMGYTFEVDLHLWMKRCWALQGLWGDYHYHDNYLEQRVLFDNIATGPGESFD